MIIFDITPLRIIFINIDIAPPLFSYRPQYWSVIRAISPFFTFSPEAAIFNIAVTLFAISLACTYPILAYHCQLITIFMMQPAFIIARWRHYQIFSDHAITSCSPSPITASYWHY